MNGVQVMAKGQTDIKGVVVASGHSGNGDGDNVIGTDPGWRGAGNHHVTRTYMQTHRCIYRMTKVWHDDALPGTIEKTDLRLGVAAGDPCRKNRTGIKLPGKRGKVGSAQHVKYRSICQRFTVINHHHLIGQTRDFINRVADVKDREFALIAQAFKIRQDFFLTRLIKGR